MSQSRKVNRLKPAKLYNKNKCIGCATCVKACPEDALSLRAIEGIVANIDRCTMCGKCAEVCPTRAIEMSGKEYTEEDVLSIILKETNIMDFSDGGVTFGWRAVDVS
ncbi:MAG: 4Fe-4S binding protein [Paludibacteraceae bacterium]